MSKKSRVSKARGPVVIIGSVIVGAIMLLFSQGNKAGLPGSAGNTQFSSAGSYDNVFVSRVVDGDTLALSGGEKVRLIGIDTPEMHESDKLYRDSKKSGQDVKTIQALGRKSYAFTRSLVEGKNVRLEFDVEKRDKYNRLLAYVYLPDGTFVNAEIVKQGYASLLTYPPNVKHADEFRILYRQAREKKSGLWKE
ncbi:MAG: thermonuclease family protein [Candidatus Omnitrophica bacterium]|jgi:micrococcal nuclease|nr:thermonuclease family protein [Candidatus Omnitrophota bacterium]